MEITRLIIKYKNRFICDNIHKEIGLIWIPPYSSESCFHNVDIFIALLCSGNMSNSYEAIKGLDYVEGLNTFETYFFEEYLSEIEENVYIYDLDKVLNDISDKNVKDKYEKNLRTLPGTLVTYSYEELIKESQKEKTEKEALFNQPEETPFLFACNVRKVDKDLLRILNLINSKRKDNDVLLLYSGGKDSTLTAIRLKNAGYNVHFIHFDNGHTMDADKPYLTFQKTFANQSGYTFEYQNKAVNISFLFNEYFSKWQQEHGDNLEGENLDSEIRCLSCRMAMYANAIIYAKNNGFKYIAEGARISQKFMLEQIPMIERLKELASKYGIELLFPVLDLVDDDKEKQELIENGFSSKSWESKCLLGRKAMNKTREDEDQILDYYESILKSSIVREIERDEKRQKILKKA